LDGNIGVLVEVNCETDFVSKNEVFRDFVKNIAMQIAATSPVCISKMSYHRDIGAGLPLEQVFIKDSSLTIKVYLDSIIAKTGENIVIRRFFQI